MYEQALLFIKCVSGVLHSYKSSIYPLHWSNSQHSARATVCCTVLVSFLNPLPALPCIHSKNFHNKCSLNVPVHSTLDSYTFCTRCVVIEYKPLNNQGHTIKLKHACAKFNADCRLTVIMPSFVFCFNLRISASSTLDMCQMLVNCWFMCSN